MRFELSSGSGLKHAVLALGLAYALAFQAIVGAAASGFHAVAAFDVAEHALCSPGRESNSGDAGAPERHGELCILSCGLVPVGIWPSAPTVPGSVFLWAERPRAPRSEPPISRIAQRPFEARAPPVLA
jgi:hypothetical protein